MSRNGSLTIMSHCYCHISFILRRHLWAVVKQVTGQLLTVEVTDIDGGGAP
jgi:hypothetical protein